MPDRLLKAAEGLRAEAETLHEDMVRFKRGQRVKNWLLVGALTAAVVVGLVVWRQDISDDRAACHQRNDSRIAIRDAFGRLPDIGEKFLPDGDPLLAELRAADRDLRESLPVTHCG